MTVPQISFEDGDHILSWKGVMDALAEGHKRPEAEIGDTFLYQGNRTLLSRSAWIKGLGLAVKTATIFPDNTGQDLPAINGALSLFSDETGEIEALIDFHLVTKWKTAGDSLLATSKLAHPDSRSILIIGAGTVAASLIDGYRELFPAAQIVLWNRTKDSADTLAAQSPGVSVAADLPDAVRRADIVSCATMSTDPVLHGEWLQPGQHIDLIGAYRPDMREADDAALRKGRIFVDSRQTTLDHIGELKIPLASGVISPQDIQADYYDFGAFTRESDEEITIFKNGGGAHLDLMVSRYIFDQWCAS
ncbi:ornithine cyclodeaminase family protein [Aestuariibius insulae]|uniref:ornithine cyclodeaminase family protein n=1 Tax=Aestuariibius insulae TaxID=2058287 RepID=UPI00345EADCC